MIATTAVIIDAPVDVIWSVMLDFKTYQDWNPFIIGVKHLPEPIDVGSRFQLHVRWADGTTIHSWETVTQLSAPSAVDGEQFAASLTYRYSSWLTRTGLLRAFREQHLSQHPGEPTKYRTQESFHGLLARFLSLWS